MGAVDSQKDLAPSRRQEWSALIQAVADEAGGGATSIDVVDVSDNSPRLVQSLPLDMMAKSAKAVGAFIASARLTALKGKSVQDIETWSNDDEDAAVAINVAASRGQPIVRRGDDAQLLAGTTMALFANPAQYNSLTSLLNDALDDSFERDPVFGPAAPHFMFLRGREVRGRSYSRTAVPPQFPISIKGGKPRTAKQPARRIKGTKR